MAKRKKKKRKASSLVDKKEKAFGAQLTRVLTANQHEDFNDVLTGERKMFFKPVG